MAEDYSRWLSQLLLEQQSSDSAGMRNLLESDQELSDQLLQLAGARGRGELLPLLRCGRLLQLLLLLIDEQPLPNWQAAEEQQRLQHFLLRCSQRLGLQLLGSDDSSILHCLSAIKSSCLQQPAAQLQRQLSASGSSSGSPRLLLESARQLAFFQGFLRLHRALDQQLLSLWHESDLTQIFPTMLQLSSLHEQLHKKLLSSSSSQGIARQLAAEQQQLMRSYCTHAQHTQLHAVPYLQNLVNAQLLSSQLEAGMRQLEQLQPARTVKELLEEPLRFCQLLLQAARDDGNEEAASCLEEVSGFVEEFAGSLPDLQASRRAFDRIQGLPQWLNPADIGCLRQQGQLHVDGKLRHCTLWDNCLVMSDCRSGQFNQVLPVCATTPAPELHDARSRRSWPLEFEKQLFVAETKELQQQWAQAMQLAKSRQWPSQNNNSHKFRLHTLALSELPARCSSCQRWLQGCQFQAFKCFSCGRLVHADCLPSLLEICPGPGGGCGSASGSLTRSNTLSKMSPKPQPRPRRPSNPVVSAAPDASRLSDCAVACRQAQAQGRIEEAGPSPCFLGEPLSYEAAAEQLLQLQQQHGSNFCVAGQRGSGDCSLQLFVISHDEVLEFSIHCLRDQSGDAVYCLQEEEHAEFDDLAHLLEYYSVCELPACDGSEQRGVRLVFGTSS